MRKKAVIIMLLTAIIINSLTGSVVMASGIDDNATGGGSSSGLSSGNGTLNWNQAKSGYRFSIIDNTGNVMSLGEDGKAGSVDVFFMNYKDIQNNLYYFTNAKTQPLSNNQLNKNLTIEELNQVAKFNSLPPYPISTDGNGNAKGNGEALRLWLMDGKKWIGKRTSSSIGSSSSIGNSSNTGGSNSTGNSNNIGNSRPTTPKYDIGKVKADIISSGKKLKIELDKNLKIDLVTKNQTYYSWLYQWKNHCIDLYDEKKITKDEYDDIILGTGLHMLNYLLDSNFIRLLMISLPNDFLFIGVESAIDKNLETYIKNLNKHSTYTTGDKRKALNYYVEGEKEHFKWLNDNGALSKNAYSYARRYIDKLVKDKYSIYSSSGNANDGKLVVMKMSTTSSVKADNKGGMVQTLSYTRTEPVYLSSAPTVAKNTDEVVVVNLSTASTTSSSTEEVEDKGEILKLLKTEFKGKPLFELPEHSLSEYAGMNTVDIMVEKGYNLLVEPLTYIQPATWDASKKGAGIYFKYHIFGTITNYAECLTLLKSKGYWSDMGGGAYSTPTSKLGWSCLMIENDSKKNMEISFVAPTKQEGTRRPMDELASVSDLSKGVIEGYGMQLYMTNPDEIEEIPEEKITPTPTPTPEDGKTSLTGDLTLEQNQIAWKHKLSEIEDDISRTFTSSVSDVSGAKDRHWVPNHVEHSHNSNCTDNCDIQYEDHGSDIDVYYTKIIDSEYEHKYDINSSASNLPSNLIADSGIFKPIIRYNTTGRQNVSNKGAVDIQVTPEYEFVIWRGSDIPTLAYFKPKNKQAIIDLKELGVTSGEVPVARLQDTGNYENKYKAGIVIGSTGGDLVTTFGCTMCANSISQLHALENDKTYNVDVVVKSYAGNEADIAKEQSKDDRSIKFKVGRRDIRTAMGFHIPNINNISFYPYVKMVYSGIDGIQKEAFVLSTNLSELNVSDYVDIGYVKSAGPTLTMKSNQWSNHRRSLNFLKENRIADRYSVLPGGATYTLDTKDETAYVGIRTWQTVLPTNTIGIVQSGGNYYDINEATDRRNDLISQIEDALESYDVVQYIAKGIIKKSTSIAQNGVSLNDIAKGRNQTVYGNRLSTDDKYYLKTATLPGSMRANEADLDVITSHQVNQTTYTIKSDTDGNVWVNKTTYPIKSDTDGNVWVEENSRTIASINVNYSIDDLLENTEVKELDDKTKLVTNYLAVIDRDKGEVEGCRWYNEAWDGISVVMTEYEMRVGFGKPDARTSALDPKLTGLLESKSDVYNFKDESKVRSSVFRTAINNNINGKPRWVATWGETDVDIIIRDIENMLISKPFYLPNSTVMDLN